MEGYGGPAQPSPPIGDALNAGFRFLEVKCAGCNTHSTVDLTTLRRPRETPIWQLEQRMRCRPCSDSGARTSRRGKSLGILAMSGITIDRQSRMAAQVRGSDTASRRAGASHAEGRRRLHHEAPEGGALGARHGGRPIPKRPRAVAVPHSVSAPSVVLRP
jgi:hypothetical protein